MFLIQDIKETQSYKAGYEVGKLIYHNPTLSILIGVVLSVGFVWLLTKIVKQIRTFGE
ncbi:hypothetical protein PG911_00440 [Tenacibaculum ovolyticum]|uniref:hypothetical protein n=1 Tax=Tenacibaculum ovolyticum TaxID=104270 RepID=UPI0022F3D848|nr:hypothetical protein [Tenacibaculum ovolyticum]WBX76760.1 hypothetical protein PG911_00440 [Tenacibaculum ovolyticum]